MRSEVMTNLESVGDMVGALVGMGQGIEEDIYLEGLIEEAHDKAANAFDLAAAATAHAGALAHVFEYGTAGITGGKPTFPDPTSPAARLYVHTITGHGGNQEVGYTFRPAKAPNPQPTVKSTGVASRYLSKLSQRKYVFWNKAFVMETGQTVEIKSERGEMGLLFVPDPNVRRGFIMYPSKLKKAIFAVPGQAVQGTFTMFWSEWWSGAGGQIMEEKMRESVSYDIRKTEAEITRRANAEAMKPVQTTNVVGAAASARQWVKKVFGASRKTKALR